MTPSSGSAAVDVSVIYSIPSPYQEQLFEHIAGRDRINLHVSYCEERTSDRDWAVDIGDYNHDIFGSVSIGGYQVNTEIIRTLIRRQPDVVVVGGYSGPTMQLAILTSWAQRIPVVLWCESHSRDWRNRKPDLRNRTKDVLLSGLVRGCSSFLVPGSLQRQYLMDHGAPRSLIQAGTHACDVVWFQETAQQSDSLRIRDSYGVTEDVIVTYVGRLIEEKGLTELIDAIGKLNNDSDDVGVIVAGSGPLESELRDRCDRRDLDNVYFPGFVSRSDLPALYGASDIFAFPSRGDPWGVVVNEAMACGLPIVTTDAVGAGYDLVVEGVNGAIVPPKDATALADAITDVVSHNPDRMGQRSQQIIEKWTHQNAAEAVERAVLGAVGEGKNRD